MDAGAIQENTFNRLWTKYSAVVERGESFGDNETPPGQYLTTVCRLNQEVQVKLAQAAKAIDAPSDLMFFYPASTIHTTFLALTPYVGNASHASDQQRVREVVTEALAAEQSFEYEVRGLGLFPTTVYAQLFIRDVDRYSAARARVADRLRRAGIYAPQAREQERSLVRSLAFANIIRFRQQVDCSIVGQIRMMRDFEFGGGTLDKIELVATDKFLSDDATSAIHQVQLKSTPDWGSP